MGVSGVGKSTISKLLAERMAWKFIEGDDFHSDSNRQKMSAGISLNDQDRLEWLYKLASIFNSCSSTTVVSCSALKRKYREILSAHSNQTTFIHLVDPFKVLERRLNARKKHFFNSVLLLDQIKLLEPLSLNEQGFKINFDQNSNLIVAEIISRLDD